MMIVPSKGPPLQKSRRHDEPISYYANYNQLRSAVKPFETRYRKKFPWIGLLLVLFGFAGLILLFVSIG